MGLLNLSLNLSAPFQDNVGGEVDPDAEPKDKGKLIIDLDLMGRLKLLNTHELGLESTGDLGTGVGVGMGDGVGVWIEQDAPGLFWMGSSSPESENSRLPCPGSETGVSTTWAVSHATSYCSASVKMSRIVRFGFSAGVTIPIRTSWSLSVTRAGLFAGEGRQ